MYADGIHADFIGCFFILNSALYGGAVAAVNTSNIIVIDSSLFNNNTVVNDSNGGVIHLLQDTSLTVVDSFVNNNSAREGGRVAYGEDRTQIIDIIQNGTFIQNSANYGSGGSIFMSDTSSCSISESRFSFNAANENGSVANI